MLDLDNFKKARVLVIGDVMLDRYWWGHVSRISPEAPVPIVSLDRMTAAPGGAANVALNAAALGASTLLIGCVGVDDAATELSDALSETGVASTHLIASDFRRTTVKTRIVAHSQQVVRIDSEDRSDICQNDIDRVAAMIDSVLPDIGIVIVSDYAKGLLARDVLARLIRQCSALGKTILVDPKGKDFSKYAGATMLTPNRREAAEACKLDESDPALVHKAGERLLAEYNFESVLITESENGMTLFQRNCGEVHFDAASHEVYDVTGAGDTVIATLGVAIAAGVDLPSAVGLANTAAGIAVGQIGTGTVALDDLQKYHGDRSRGATEH